MDSRPIFKLCFSIIFALFLVSPSLQSGHNQEAEKPAVQRVLSAEDTLRIDQVSNPHLSPDGQWVVYTMSTRDMEDKDYKSTTHIWKVDAGGEEKGRKKGKEVRRRP